VNCAANRATCQGVLSFQRDGRRPSLAWSEYAASVGRLAEQFPQICDKELQQIRPPPSLDCSIRAGALAPGRERPLSASSHPEGRQGQRNRPIRIG